MVYKIITKRGGDAKSLAESVQTITARTFGVRGLSNGTIVRYWRDIVGQSLALVSTPEKITFTERSRSKGTLHLRVQPGGLATELQHLAPLVLERVNQFFGYECVSRLEIKQGNISTSSQKKLLPIRKLTTKEEQQLAATASEISDPDLRKTIRALGKAVFSRTFEKIK